MTTVESAEQFEPLAVRDLQDGEYRGMWSGYEAIATINGKFCRFRTSQGIRGRAPCTIRIKDGEATVEALKVGV